MKYIKTLPSVEEFKNEYPLTKEQKGAKQKDIEEIQVSFLEKAKNYLSLTRARRIEKML